MIHNKESTICSPASLTSLLSNPNISIPVLSDNEIKSSMRSLRSTLTGQSISLVVHNPNGRFLQISALDWSRSKRWWRHQMETFSALLAICAGNSPFPVNSPHKGQWRGALMFSKICVWINGWVNNREAGDLRRYRANYEVIVMPKLHSVPESESCPLKYGHISMLFV